MLRSAMSSSDSMIIAVAIISILAALAVAYALTLTQANTNTECCTTVTAASPNDDTVKLIGLCNSTDYFLPDTLQIIPVTVTNVHNGTTTHYISTSTLSPTTEIINSTFYTTTLSTDISTRFVTTNTTNLDPESPSGEWAVATCSFAPK